MKTRFDESKSISCCKSSLKIVTVRLYGISLSILFSTDISILFSTFASKCSKDSILWFVSASVAGMSAKPIPINDATKRNNSRDLAPI